MINSGYSHISVPAQELHSRAAQVSEAPSLLSQSNHREKSQRKAEKKEPNYFMILALGPPNLRNKKSLG